MFNNGKSCGLCVLWGLWFFIIALFVCLFVFFLAAMWENTFCRSIGNGRNEFHRCKCTVRKTETVKGFHGILLAAHGMTSIFVHSGAAMHHFSRCPMVVQPVLPLLLLCVRSYLQPRDESHPQPQILQSWRPKSLVTKWEASKSQHVVAEQQVLESEEKRIFAEFWGRSQRNLT